MSTAFPGLLETSRAGLLVMRVDVLTPHRVLQQTITTNYRFVVIWTFEPCISQSSTIDKGAGETKRQSSPQQREGKSSLVRD